MESPANFRSTVMDYYRDHGRSFLWRDQTDPYLIYLSEVMLQQTQTSRVAQLLPRFIARFPDFQAIAAGSLGDVLAAWQGLGYNRRAKNLHLSARILLADHQATVPDDPRILESLPGIGPNTAASIAVYAYNRPYPFVETNIRTVYIHHFFPPSPPNVPPRAIKDRDILGLVEETMLIDDPRTWFWALMDYGVHLKKTLGNLSRRSQAYSPQGTFKGSLREARGALIRVLSGSGLEKGDLPGACPGIKPELLYRALVDLETEGLVAENAGFYRLP